MPSAIPHIKNIEAYNFKINIPTPRYTDFDVRSFEDNMKTVRLQMPPFRLSFFQLALLESGNGTVSSDGFAYNLNNFTLFFNQPNQIIYWDVDQNWKGYYLSLNDSFYTVQLDGFKSLHDLPFFSTFTPAIALKQEEAALIIDLLQRMHQEYARPTPYNKTIVQSYLSTVLAYSLRFYDRANQEHAQQARNSKLSDRFKALIRHQVNGLLADVGNKDLSVASCADQLFVTPKYLAEVIKRDLGVTPTDYINQRLIEESKRLLLASDLQVKAIAYQLGFNDASYFNRLFKKVTGQSPAQYRNTGA